MSVCAVICAVQQLLDKKVPKSPLLKLYILKDNFSLIRRQKCDGANRKCHYYSKKTGKTKRIPGYKCECFFFYCEDCGKDCWEDEEEGWKTSCWECMYKKEPSCDSGDENEN